MRCRMVFSKNELLARTRGYVAMAAILFGLYTLMCAVIYPFCVMTSNDFLYDATIVPELLDYLYKVLELVAISCAYAFIIFTVFSYTLKGSLGGLLIFFGATVYKSALNMLADWAMNGSVPVDWTIDIWDALFYTLLETLVLVIVLFVIFKISQLRRGDKKGYLSLIDGEYPYSSVFAIKNYYLRAAFGCAIAVFASKVFGRLYNDLQSIVFWGLPKEGITWVIMGLSYLLEAVSGVLCYAVIALVISRILAVILKNSVSTAE